MERRFFWLACACLVAGSLSGVPLAIAQEKGNPLIIPGQSVGEIRLGMENQEIERQLGKPAAGDTALGRTWMAWFGKKEGGGRGVELDIRSRRSVEHENDPAAIAIRVEAPFFRTKEGVGTGSSLADVWKIFPNLRYDDNDPYDKAVEIYVDDGHGIAIEVRRTQTNPGVMISPPSGAWGICQAILIFPVHSFFPGASSLHSMRNSSDE